MVNMAKVTVLGIQKYDVIFVESKNNENREELSKWKFTSPPF
jgi:hypothetical protein